MKSLMPSFRSLKLPFKLPSWINRPPLYLSVGVGAVVLLGAIVWYSTKPTNLSNHWQPAELVSNSADINLVVDSYIQLSPELTRDAIASQLTATKVNHLVIYKFAFPDTCGFAGCLYVMSDTYARSIPLQLWDEPYFQPTDKSNCLTVEQRGKNYEVCLK
jgi:hypothetical protein